MQLSEEDKGACIVQTGPRMWKPLCQINLEKLSLQYGKNFIVFSHKLLGVILGKFICNQPPAFFWHLQSNPSSVFAYNHLYSPNNIIQSPWPTRLFWLLLTFDRFSLTLTRTKMPFSYHQPPHLPLLSSTLKINYDSYGKNTIVTLVRVQG